MTGRKDRLLGGGVKREKRRGEWKERGVISHP